MIDTDSSRCRLAVTSRIQGLFTELEEHLLMGECVMRNVGSPKIRIVRQ